MSIRTVNSRFQQETQRNIYSEEIENENFEETMKRLYIFLLLISENSRCCCWDTHWPVFLNLITTRSTNLADKSENQSSHFTIQIRK